MVHNFSVLQLKDSNSLHYYRFAGLHLLNKMGLKVELKNYEEVYSSSISTSEKNSLVILESLYMQFQGRKPEGYKGHSLSVSDIVKLDEDYYYCDSFGFTKITF